MKLGTVTAGGAHALLIGALLCLQVRQSHLPPAQYRALRAALVDLLEEATILRALEELPRARGTA